MCEPVTYLTKAEERAFKRHVAGLNNLIRQIREHMPEAQYYLACGGGSGTLNILSGDSHEGASGTPRQDRVIEGLELYTSDGGDW